MDASIKAAAVCPQVGMGDENGGAIGMSGHDLVGPAQDVVARAEFQGQNEPLAPAGLEEMEAVVRAFGFPVVEATQGRHAFQIRRRKVLRQVVPASRAQIVISGHQRAGHDSGESGLRRHRDLPFRLRVFVRDVTDVQHVGDVALAGVVGNPLRLGRQELGMSLAIDFGIGQHHQRRAAVEPRRRLLAGAAGSDAGSA